MPQWQPSRQKGYCGKQSGRRYSVKYRQWLWICSRAGRGDVPEIFFVNIMRSTG